MIDHIIYLFIFSLLYRLKNKFHCFELESTVLGKVSKVFFEKFCNSTQHNLCRFEWRNEDNENVENFVRFLPFPSTCHFDNLHCHLPASCEIPMLVIEHMNYFDVLDRFVIGQDGYYVEHVRVGQLQTFFLIKSQRLISDIL